jgi:hypothetical protein
MAPSLARGHAGAAQQRAATTQTPRRPTGAGGGEERAYLPRNRSSSSKRATSVIERGVCKLIADETENWGKVR